MVDGKRFTAGPNQKTIGNAIGDVGNGKKKRNKKRSWETTIKGRNKPTRKRNNKERNLRFFNAQKKPKKAKSYKRERETQKETRPKKN